MGGTSRVRGEPVGAGVRADVLAGGQVEVGSGGGARVGKEGRMPQFVLRWRGRKWCVCVPVFSLCSCSSGPMVSWCDGGGSPSLSPPGGKQARGIGGAFKRRKEDEMRER